MLYRYNQPIALVAAARHIVEFFICKFAYFRMDNIIIWVFAHIFAATVFFRMLFRVSSCFMISLHYIFWLAGDYCRAAA